MLAMTVGQLLIVHNMMLVLIPNFFVSPSLLASDNVELFKSVHRPAFLMAAIPGVLINLLWNWLVPQAMPERISGLLLVLSALCSMIARAFVVGYFVGIFEYTLEVSFGLQLTAQLFAIPTVQLGTIYTVCAGPSESQARLRILGWIITVALGLIALFVPIFATGPVTVVVSVIPSLFLAFLLCTASTTAHPAGDSALPTAVGFTSTSTALLFVCYAGLFGTNSEALLDSFIGVLSRSHIKLAVWNQAAVFVAMLGAFCAEARLTKMDKTAAERSGIYILAWACAQFLRVFCLSSIDGESGRLVFGLVLVDKFTGPLGSAAVEVALLSLLSKPRVPKNLNSRHWVPVAFLMVFRLAVEGISRPAAEWLILPFLQNTLPGGAIEVAVIAFTTGTVMWVRFATRTLTVEKKKSS